MQVIISNRSHPGKRDTCQIWHFLFARCRSLNSNSFKCEWPQARLKTFINSTEAPKNFSSLAADSSIISLFLRCSFCVAIPTGQLFAWQALSQSKHTFYWFVLYSPTKHPNCLFFFASAPLNRLVLLPQNIIPHQISLQDYNKKN